MVDVTAPLASRPFTRGRARRYWMYGMEVESDLVLDAQEHCVDYTADPEVVVRRMHVGKAPLPDCAPVATIQCRYHGTEMIEYRAPCGIWIWLKSIATFHIALNAREVEVYRDEQADEREVGLALAGPILLLVRFQRGCPSLHASAIVTPRGAVGFLGPRGRGKSTLAASFLRSGNQLLTDDALILSGTEDGVYGTPGAPFMKIWSETARHTLALSDDLPNLSRHLEKKLLTLHHRYPVATAPTRVHALYLLDRYESATAGRQNVRVEELSGREALGVLFAHSSLRQYLVPGDEAAAFPLYARLLSQARVRVLHYPDGFQHQDAVRTYILEDIERC